MNEKQEKTEEEKLIFGIYNENIQRISENNFDRRLTEKEMLLVLDELDSNDDFCCIVCEIDDVIFNSISLIINGAKDD